MFLLFRKRAGEGKKSEETPKKETEDAGMESPSASTDRHNHQAQQTQRAPHPTQPKPQQHEQQQPQQPQHLQQPQQPQETEEPQQTEEPQEAAEPHDLQQKEQHILPSHVPGNSENVDSLKQTGDSVKQTVISTKQTVDTPEQSVDPVEQLPHTATHTIVKETQAPASETTARRTTHKKWVYGTVVSIIVIVWINEGG